MGPWGPYGGQHEGMGPWGPFGPYGFDAGPWSIPGIKIDWTAPQIPKLGSGAIIGAQAGGVLALLAERGKPEVVVPWEDVGKPWEEVLQGMPHLGSGGIIGTTQQMPNISSAVGSSLADAIKAMRQSPMYQVNATIDAESIKRDILQAILELEQFHHLGNMGNY